MNELGANTTNLAVLAGRRAFPKSQDLMVGAPSGVMRRMQVGWHGTSVSPETGAFAVVRRGGGFDDLVGRIVVVSLQQRVVFVYVLSDAIVTSDISLARRAFAELSRLSRGRLVCDVGAVG